jgi:hypothetical protein
VWPGSSIGSSPCVPASPAAPTAREAIRRPAPRGRLWLVSYRAGLPAISRRERPGPRTYQVRTSRSAAGDGSSAGKAAVCGGPRPAIEELELAMNTPPIISVGATGPTVTWAQYLLVRWTLSYTQIDGIFRPVTKTAVEQFQAESHLTALNAFRGRALLMTHLPVAGLPGLLCRPAGGVNLAAPDRIVVCAGGNVEVRGVAPPSVSSVARWRV